MRRRNAGLLLLVSACAGQNGLLGIGQGTRATPGPSVAADAPGTAVAPSSTEIRSPGPVTATPPGQTPEPETPATQAPPPARLEAIIAAREIGAWQDMPPLKHPRAFHGMFRYRGTVMAMGGDTRNQVELLDETTGQWLARPFADPGTGWDRPPYVPAYMHPLSPPVLFGPWVMLLANPLETGGFTIDFTPQLFNPITGQMGRGPASLSSFHAHRTAVGAVSDALADHVWVAGGEATQEGPIPTPATSDFPPHLRATFRSFERVTFSTLRWQRLADLPEPVSDPAVAWRDGEVLLAGGLSWLDENGQPGVTEAGHFVIDANVARPAARSHCWSYDTKADTWTRLPDLPLARHGARAAILGRNLWVIGGRDGSGHTVARCDVLDLDSRSWSTGPTLRRARSHAAVRADEAGQLWVTGGLDAGRRPMDTVELLRSDKQP